MNTEKIMEDIQSVQDNIREIKSTWGNTIMTLDNIKSGLKADVQKKVDEAYQRGYDDATKMIASDEQSIADKAYQSGLDDAWDAARKIACTPQEEGLERKILDTVFGDALDRSEIMFAYSAQEVIDKIKAYEDKQKEKDRFEVGDIVRSNEFKDIAVCVTYVDEGWNQFSGIVITDTHICRRGHTYASRSKDEWHKTGEHFDIEQLWKGES